MTNSSPKQLELKETKSTEIYNADGNEAFKNLLKRTHLKINSIENEIKNMKAENHHQD